MGDVDDEALAVMMFGEKKAMRGMNHGESRLGETVNDGGSRHSEWASLSCGGTGSGILQWILQFSAVDTRPREPCEWPWSDPTCCHTFDSSYTPPELLINLPTTQSIP